MKSGELTPKEARFVKEYLVDLNMTQAAIRAGYSAKSADELGAKAMRRPRVAKAITKAMEARGEKTEITAERTVRELARLGYSDIRRLMKWSEQGVVFIPSEELTDDEAAAVQSVKSETITRVVDRDGNTETRVKIEMKLHDKNTALTQLGRHQGLYVDRHEHAGVDGKALNINVIYESSSDQHSPAAPAPGPAASHQ